MSVISDIDASIDEIAVKLAEVEELLLGLPIRPGQKRVIWNQIVNLREEIEGAVELSAVDYE